MWSFGCLAGFAGLLEASIALFFALLGEVDRVLAEPAEFAAGRVNSPAFAEQQREQCVLRVRLEDRAGRESRHRAGQRCVWVSLVNWVVIGAGLVCGVEGRCSDGVGEGLLV